MNKEMKEEMIPHIEALAEMLAEEGNIERQIIITPAGGAVMEPTSQHLSKSGMLKVLKSTLADLSLENKVDA